MSLLGFSCLVFWLFFCVDGGVGADDVVVVAANPSQSPPLPPPALPRPNFSPFRPSIAVIVGVLTTMFSITFLLLLYAKHCKRGNGVVYTGTPPLSSAARKNSGIDRTVIESLPVFRFASLRGQKDGLECAVCLNRFEPTEILRLLPKCKHAFHVECVDTWLDAHSTCPLCRYRVDPEDILLVEEPKISVAPPPEPDPPEVENRTPNHETQKSGEFRGGIRRRGRGATEKGRIAAYQRRQKQLRAAAGPPDHSFRRWIGGFHQRWSDVQPSDLLYLRSEMIISDNRRLSSVSGSRPSLSSKGRQHRQSHQLQLHSNRKDGEQCHGTIEGGSWSGRSVINSRSVSEITGLSRLGSNYHHLDRHHQQRQAGVVSRWLAWISQSRPSVRSERAVTVAL
ncbi:RING-H2 finger protein ATL43 [Vitis vinifera]|uniref:RING-type E3 ubiquitin transferase n=1 Tax=Vitis vinifera TaxID=29760 RepID=A0A438CZ81_VITVI|nr:RING-H2 finger protein ATL43 [Vitis vinifera]